MLIETANTVKEEVHHKLEGKASWLDDIAMELNGRNTLII